MDFSPEEERGGIHAAVNLHTKRIATAFYSILESLQVEVHRDCLLRTDIDNFQVKLHSDFLLHSCRSLYTVASDIAIHCVLHASEPLLEGITEEEVALKCQLVTLRKQVSEFEGSLKQE